ncbi:MULTISPECIES: hypothetical protein [unclassified Sphingomonas]|uniref:hypothetical protein n=1 Tax=unclassified Sphingomonas TaxID=196159 RepID=UPI00226A8DA9|nr:MULTISPECIES: hypothetical protein [unclassified Sphingomonas]
MLKSMTPLHIAKVAASLCACGVVLLSFGAMQVAGSMGAHPLGQPSWIFAIVVIPIFAISMTIWASLHESRLRVLAIAAYFSVIASPILWIAVTRS